MAGYLVKHSDFTFFTYWLFLTFMDILKGMRRKKGGDKVLNSSHTFIYI